MAAKKKKTPGLRASINAFCKACIYDPNEPGTWRKQIEECTAKDCPLYAVRPGRTKRSTSNE